jgi:hypothetical protein
MNHTPGALARGWVITTKKSEQVFAIAALGFAIDIGLMTADKILQYIGAGIVAIFCVLILTAHWKDFYDAYYNRNIKKQLLLTIIIVIFLASLPIYSLIIRPYFTNKENINSAKMGKNGLPLGETVNLFKECKLAYFPITIKSGESVRLISFNTSNYPPPASSDQAEMAPSMVWKGLHPDRRAVSTVDRMAASASAAHLAR